MVAVNAVGERGQVWTGSASTMTGATEVRPLKYVGSGVGKEKAMTGGVEEMKTLCLHMDRQAGRTWEVCGWARV
jgi:hypothetical protein